MRRSLSPTDLAQKAFVRGLPDSIDEDALRRLFSKYGNVTEVHIAKDRETNEPRGFAFITFNSSTDCSKACEGLDGKDYHGQTLQVELASHARKPGRGGFGGSGRGRSSFRGGRGGGSPSRDGYRRGGGSYRGSWRGGRGDYKGGYGSRMSEERFRGSYDRELPPRDYGSRFESSFEYRSGRSERDYLDARDYQPYRGARDYPPPGDRDYPPPRGRDFGGYYSPPRGSRDYPPGGRDYPPGGRDYPPGGRDYPMSRSDRDFDLPPRRYASRDFDDYPPASSGLYDSRPPRRDYEPRGPPTSREFGTSARFESFGNSGRGSFKSPRGSFRESDFGGRGGAVSGRRPPRDDDRLVGSAGARRSQRSTDGPPSKKMKGDEPIRRSPRGGPASRRY